MTIGVNKKSGQIGGLAMCERLKNGKIPGWQGILFQIPVWVIAIFGLRKLAEIVWYSLTNYNMVEPPSLIGFENYSTVLGDDVFQTCLGNTAVMVCAVAALLILTAVLPALFMARLKLPFGVIVMGAFFLVSACAILPNFLRILFSGDSYGLLNLQLLSDSKIAEPIAFTQSYAMPLAVLVMWLYSLAPVFSITYIAARMNHHFLGAALAVCAVPLFMWYSGDFVLGIVGYPSAEYAADWLYSLMTDYLTVRFEVGLAHTVLVIGLLLLIGWCGVVCAVACGAWVLCKKVKSNHRLINVVGYIAFAISVSLAFTVFAYVGRYLARAFMPLDEIFLFPNDSYIPKRPTLQNFSNLSALLSSTWIDLSRVLRNSLVAIPLVTAPFCFVIAAPSGIGLGAFQAFKRQKLLLLFFIPFLFVAGYVAMAKMEILDSYSVYAMQFLASFEFLAAVFLAYLTTRLVFYNRKIRISGIVVGVLFLITSFYALGAFRGIWYSHGSAIYSQTLASWRSVGTYLSAGGVARSGVAAANDMLMLLATGAIAIVPLGLLIALYGLYRKNTLQAAQKNPSGKE